MGHKRLNVSSSAILIWGLVCLIGEFYFFGCKGPTLGPTDPTTPDLTPTPIISPIPGMTPTPTPSGGEITPTPVPVTGDNYADTPYDPKIKTLIPDDNPSVITMDYTGDVDWYKIQIPYDAKLLDISLTDIPERCDFDIVAYDQNLVEMKNGRSAQSGNHSEYLALIPTGTLIYLQIYSYSGKGKATLLLVTQDPDTPEDPDTPFRQLTYEEILSQYFPLYPRGSSSNLLEHAIETIETKEITCRMVTSELKGSLTIGNYAHVERDLFDLTDYIDGWTLVVFSGPTELLEEINLTIRVTIVPDLNLEVRVPFEIEKDGNDYLVSNSETSVYYISESYGDFWSNSSDDIRISTRLPTPTSGTNLKLANIFTQQVEVEWIWSPSGGRRCTGKTTGKEIVDFELPNAVRWNTPSFKLQQPSGSP